MTDNRTQITLWLSDSQKENWDEYANTLGFESRSEMVRRAVEHFHGVKTEGGEQQQDIQSSIEDLHDTVEKIQGEVYAMRSEQLTQEDTEDLATELAYQVQEQISNVSPDVDDYQPPNEAIKEALKEVIEETA